MYANSIDDILIFIFNSHLQNIIDILKFWNLLSDYIGIVNIDPKKAAGYLHSGIIKNVLQIVHHFQRFWSALSICFMRVVKLMLGVVKWTVSFVLPS